MHTHQTSLGTDAPHVALSYARLLGAWLELSAPPHCCNMYFMAEGQPLSSTARVSAAGNQAPHLGRTRHPALAFLMPLRRKREPQAALPRSCNSEGMSTALPRCSPLRGQCPLQLGVRLHSGDSHRAWPRDLLLEVLANSKATLAPLLLSPLDTPPNRGGIPSQDNTFPANCFSRL